MSDAKTQPTGVPADTFLATVEPAVRRTDAIALRDLLAGITGEPAEMWGPSIIGFGRYRLVYESGREGDWPVIGFSPRKASLVVYLASGFSEKAELMRRLGQPKTGVSCLYLKRLADIDMDALRELCEWSVAQVRGHHPHC